MTQYVAFIRAINVAGHARVRMSHVAEAFAAAGCTGVITYIQSGNVIFESPERGMAALLEGIRAKLRDLLGGEPGIVVRSVRDLEEIVRGAPFEDFDAKREIKLYVAFLFRKPPKKPSFPLLSSKEALEAVAMRNLEMFIVSRRKKNGFYGFPNNFIEQELGVPATSRNWSTLTKIVELVRSERDTDGVR